MGAPQSKTAVRVLLIEDEPDDVYIMKEELKRAASPAAEFRLLNAPTLKEGLSLLRKEGADVVLLDLELPDSHGRKTFERALSEAPSVPIVILTGVQDERLGLEAVAKGAQDYLIKGSIDGPLLGRVLLFAVERKRSISRLDALLEKTSEGMLVLDDAGAVRYVNPAAERLFGRRAADWLGKELGMPVPGGSRSEVKLRLAGGEKILEMAATEIEWQGTQARLVLINDLTERRKAEEAEILRKREALQREFVADVSHILQTPVAAIKIFAETLRRGGLEDEKNRLRFVRIIERHVERLSRVVQDLLRLSSLEADRPLSNPEPFFLAALIEDFLGEMAPFAAQKNLEIDVQVAPDLRVLADRRQLQNALQCLFENAVKFSPRGGRISLLGSRKSGEALLSVRDGGPGIPPEELPHLFERFHRGSRRGSGTGLGLAIVKKIVEAQGGRAWAESVEGEGAEFKLTLPVA